MISEINSKRNSVQVLFKSKMFTGTLCLLITIFAHGAADSIGKDTGNTSINCEIYNPLIEHRADPWCIRHTDGYYYFTATVPEYDRIELRRARTIAGLTKAEPVVIWRKHNKGPMSYHIWAPEIHHIDGRWYIYFAAGRAEDIWAIRIYVLECAAANPLRGNWTEKGQLKTNWESFSLDATTFKHRGMQYLVWAQKDPNIRGNTNLYIAQMDSPCSITGRQIMITKPEFEWERVGFWVNEGPAVLIRNGHIFLSYSASATDHNYCIGLLTADESANLLNPESWQKATEPVFKSSVKNSQYGPGHNSFTVTPDGQTDMFFYHARNYKEIQGDPLKNPDRHTRVQKFGWKQDGTPDFGEPIADGYLNDQAAQALVKRGSFPNDPALLLRGVVLQEKPSAPPRNLRGDVDEEDLFSLTSKSILTFTISGDHVLSSIDSGRWQLGGTLKVEFAGRYEPHECAVFPLFTPGVKSLKGRFERVEIPPGWYYDLEYENEAKTVTLRNLRPDRAPAFPGAEGFGRYTIGGRGGKVYEVTNLNDSGPGSLRWACEAAGPRIVVFRTSGTIALKSKLQIKNPYITIAGQTAPGDGMCLRDNMMEFETDHVIIRYMRFRLGDVSGQESDSFGGKGRYAIIDHCSASWSVDETFSINKASNLTVQWCMVTESLHNSIHKKGKHGYGGLWGGPGGSWHHNILAHHASRNPRASGNEESGLMDFRNNVIYNWGFNSAYGGEGWPRNWINNYYKYGPGTNKNVRSRIFIQHDPNSKMYADGNFVWGYPEISADNWAGGIDFQTDQGASIATLRVHEPFVVAPVRTQEATEAYELVLKNAGASLARDAVDKRIIHEILTGTATYSETGQGGYKGIINSQSTVGGWPDLASAPAPKDTDHDGMPDVWEQAHMLDAENPADGSEDRNCNGYTNVEEYLNSLVPMPM